MEKRFRLLTRSVLAAAVVLPALAANTVQAADYY